MISDYDYVPTSSGMITHSATNPTDEIPIGPQIYPYGTPQLSQSTIEPYMGTDYNTGFASEVPITGDYQLGGVQTTTEYMQPEVQYETSQYETYTAPQVSYGETPLTYDTGAYQTTEYQGAGYETYSAPNLSTSIRYQPVTETVMVPKVTTSYVPSGVDPLTPPQLIPMPPPPPVGDPHYISNYPIYEYDPRRSLLLQSLNANPALAGGLGANPALAGGLGANPALAGGLGANPCISWWIRGKSCISWWIRGKSCISWWIRGKSCIIWWIRGKSCIIWWISCKSWRIRWIR